MSITAFLALATLVAPAQAQRDRSAQAEERLRQAQERLALSDEQLERVAPVLEDSVAAQRQILASYGIDLDSADGSSRLSLREARAMCQALQGVRKDTLTALDGILSDAQLEAFEALQAERQEALRQRLRARRS